MLKRNPLLFDGLITGLIGAAAAAAFWFFIVDTVTSTPFYTSAAMGSAVLLGAAAAPDVQLNLLLPRSRGGPPCFVTR